MFSRSPQTNPNRHIPSLSSNFATCTVDRSPAVQMDVRHLVLHLPLSGPISHHQWYGSLPRRGGSCTQADAGSLGNKRLRGSSHRSQTGLLPVRQLEGCLRPQILHQRNGVSTISFCIQSEEMCGREEDLAATHVCLLSLLLVSQIHDPV